MRAPIVNFLTQFSIASSLLFIPLFAKELGASDFEIGLISSAYSFAIFFSSIVFGRVADFFNKRIVMSVGLLLSAAFFFAQCLVRDAVQLLFVRTLLGFSLGIFPPALISYAYSVNRKVGYFSAFGSLGWAFGQLIAGFIVSYCRIFALGALLTFIALTIVVRERIPQDIVAKKRSSLKIVMDNFSVYFAFFIRHVGASAVWLIFPIYLSNLGISKFWIGVIYFTNSFLQFLMMQRIETLSSRKLMTIGSIFSGITFYLYSISSQTWHFLVAQIFIALGWSSLYVGALKAVLDKNLERSSVAGFLNSTIYLSTIVGSLIGGLIAEEFGYVYCLYFGAFLSFLSAFIRK